MPTRKKNAATGQKTIKKLPTKIIKKTEIKHKQATTFARRDFFKSLVNQR